MSGSAGIKRPYYPTSGHHNNGHNDEHPSPLSQQHQQTSQSVPTGSHGDRHLSHNAPAESSSLENSAAAFSAFRNVSACNRCRLRKNRCDTRLPRCSACERAKVKCTGYDPVHKREIPRSYVYWLENRVAYFESLLNDHGIPYRPPEAFDPDLSAENGQGHSLGPERSASLNNGNREDSSVEVQGAQEGQGRSKDQNEKEKLNKLVSDVGMVSAEGASDPRWLGSTSGVPFAKVVFAAIKSSISTNNSEKSSVRASKPANSITVGSSMRDSAFRLQAAPITPPAAFPAKALGEKLVNLYFEHANPQIPILHRDHFKEQIFDKAYPEDQRSHLARRELYMLNMVFAIGAGIIYGSSDQESEMERGQNGRDPSSPLSKRAKLNHRQHQPEEYHAAAMVNFDSIFGSSSAFERTDGFGGGLEELQALLLLASFALLRPVTPGLWHIVGVAVRTALELGLHSETGLNLEGATEEHANSAVIQDTMTMDTAHLDNASRSMKSGERGRREWVRDLRRRLLWSTYSLDRLVSTCVGRPIGIVDQAITTEFPSMLDDQYITHGGFLKPPTPDLPSYKRVSYHYFRLRLLQSEILQVLQYREARQARHASRSGFNGSPHIDLHLPFLDPFGSFRAWRKDIDTRLWEWKCSAPTQEQTGVQFQPLFLELNYWQAVIMLYRQSLAVPTQLASISTPVDDLASPSISTIEEKDDEDEVFLKVAEAGQQVLRVYRTLHRVRLVNYTYLATHHLFMAGISFLYALWYSPVVRSRLTLDEVDFTILAATSVLGDLTEKCPPADACKSAFERMSKATVQMCLSTTGFGFQVATNFRNEDQQSHVPPVRTSSIDTVQLKHLPQHQANEDRQSMRPPKSQRPPPRFDMGLKDLFSDDISQHDLTSQSFSNSLLSGQQRQHYRPQPGLSRSMPPAQQNPPSGSQSFLPAAQFPNISPIDQKMQTYDADASMPTPTSVTGLPSTQTPTSSDLSASQQADAYAQVQAQAQTQPLPSTFNFGPTIDFSSMPDMSFLDSFNANDSSDPFGNGNGGGAIDLGFGMNMDMQHDWSEGTQFDLLDGFFFGGGGGSGGPGGGGAATGAAGAAGAGGGFGGLGSGNGNGNEPG